MPQLRRLQAHLALGRALISLEKWNEAETPLKQALALQPEDPEPMNDPWGRTPTQWNYGREPTYGEQVPNPKGDFWYRYEQRTKS